MKTSNNTCDAGLLGSSNQGELLAMPTLGCIVSVTDEINWVQASQLPVVHGISHLEIHIISIYGQAPHPSLEGILALTKKITRFCTFWACCFKISFASIIFTPSSWNPALSLLNLDAYEMSSVEHLQLSSFRKITMVRDLPDTFRG